MGKGAMNFSSVVNVGYSTKILSLTDLACPQSSNYILGRALAFYFSFENTFFFKFKLPIFMYCRRHRSKLDKGGAETPLRKTLFMYDRKRVLIVCKLSSLNGKSEENFD